MHSISFEPPVIAHRGASGLAPENTLAAFKKAAELGIKWIEFDVMLAACGEIIVIHDETLDRTTNGTGNVWDYPYSYLKTLDAGSWFNPKFANERIPTFREVIELIKQNKLAANIEIKALPGQEDLTVKKVLGELKQYWTADMPQPLISSFSMVALQYVRKYAPNALIAMLLDDWLAAWESMADEMNCASLDLNYEIVTEEKVKVIHDMGKYVLCYTVNDPEVALQLFDWGVDGVFSDKSELIVEALKK